MKIDFTYKPLPGAHGEALHILGILFSISLLSFGEYLKI